MREHNRRVVITGYGALCSLGANSDQIWRSVVDKKLGYKLHEFSDQRIKAKFFGMIDAETIRDQHQGFSKGLLRKLSDFAKYALISGREALQAAFAGANPAAHYSPFDCGVIIGTGWGGLDSANANNTEYNQSRFASPFATIMSMNNVATAALSMHFGLKGFQNTPVAACASGAIAIGEAVEVIRRGQARCMLAGGSESLRDVFNVWSIDVLDALSKEVADPSKACCPFSLDRSGFVLSEGAAVVCLEEMESAVARGARILAEVSGYHNCSDAYDFTAPAPDCQGRFQVIAGALREAGMAPGQISYVNAHGTSTPLNDHYETLALKEVMGQAAYEVPISSTKSYTGHLIGAAGAMETIICVKAIENNLIPATINLMRPDPACDLNYAPNQHVTGVPVDACLNLSFGFGGANAALVIKRVEA